MSIFHETELEAWTLLGIGLAITALRTYARVRAVGFGGLRGDDYLAWVAAVLYIIESGMIYGVSKMANSLSGTPLSAAQLEVLTPQDSQYQLRVIGSKMQLAAWVTYSSLLWVLKASLLVFYIRLTEGLNQRYRLRIMIGFGLLAGSYIIATLTLFLSCRPFHKYWQISPDPGNTCHPAISPPIIGTYLCFNIATDLYLLSIPVPMLWTSTLRPVKKAGLILLFSGGIFVIACSIVRSALILKDITTGPELAGPWELRENFVAVATTNLPLIFPLLKGWLTPIFGSLLTSVRSTQRVTGATPKDFRTLGESSRTWRGRGGPSTSGHPITNISLNDSEERMVENIKMQELKIWSDPSTSSIPRNDMRKDVRIEIVSKERAVSDERVGSPSEEAQTAAASQQQQQQQAQASPAASTAAAPEPSSS